MAAEVQRGADAELEGAVAAEVVPEGGKEAHEDGQKVLRPRSVVLRPVRVARAAEGLLQMGEEGRMERAG